MHAYRRNKRKKYLLFSFPSCILCIGEHHSVPLIISLPTFIVCCIATNETQIQKQSYYPKLQLILCNKHCIWVAIFPVVSIYFFFPLDSQHCCFCAQYVCNFIHLPKLLGALMLPSLC